MESKKDRVISILVHNRAGVLMRVVSLFSRRGFNIESLSVGTTEDPAFSRITIALICDRTAFEQIKRQVEKLVDIIKVFEMQDNYCVKRELLIIKVKCNEDNRSKILELCDIFKAKIVDATPESMSVQIIGDFSKIKSFLTLAKPYGIIELVKTGITAIERGSRALADIEMEN